MFDKRVELSLDCFVDGEEDAERKDHVAHDPGHGDAEKLFNLLWYGGYEERGYVRIS